MGRGSREETGAADRFQIAALLELLGDGDQVGGRAGVVERDDRREDLLVRRAVEGLGVDHLDRLPHGLDRFLPHNVK